MLELFQKTCQTLNSNNIRYCVLRMPEKTTNDEYEVDVFVPLESMQLFYSVVTYPSAEFNFVYTEGEKGPHHHFRKENLHIDVVTSIAYGKNRNFEVMSSKECEAIIDRAWKYYGVPIVSNEDNFKMLLMHCLFDKEDFSKYKDKLINLKSTIGERKCLTMIQSIFH